ELGGEPQPSIRGVEEGAAEVRQHPLLLLAQELPVVHAGPPAYAVALFAAVPARRAGFEPATSFRPITGEAAAYGMISATAWRCLGLIRVSASAFTRSWKGSMLPGCVPRVYFLRTLASRTTVPFIVTLLGLSLSASSASAAR